jgi:hypothetical protein
MTRKYLWIIAALFASNPNDSFGLQQVLPNGKAVCKSENPTFSSKRQTHKHLQRRPESKPRQNASTLKLRPLPSLTKLYQSSTSIIDEDQTSLSETPSKIQISTPSVVVASTPSSAVPTTMSDAIKVFFFSGDYGPSWIVLTLGLISYWRLDVVSTPLGLIDVVLFGGSVIFWWIQEHFLHDKVLHSKFDWIGKQIHQAHHDKPYYHISVDSVGLLLGWMVVAHFVLFRWWLPLPLALSATLGYSVAGLFYEWAHFIVHTKVRFRGFGSRFWVQVRDNHIRHHRICSDFWFAFSIPWIDDLFQSNPSVKDVQKNIQSQPSQ